MTEEQEKLQIRINRMIDSLLKLLNTEKVEIGVIAMMSLIVHNNLHETKEAFLGHMSKTWDHLKKSSHLS